MKVLLIFPAGLRLPLHLRGNFPAGSGALGDAVAVTGISSDGGPQ